MLGYFFFCGIDVFVCLSFKFVEVIIIEVWYVFRDERLGGVELMDVNMVEGREEFEGLEDVLGC